jgi:C1A family cysteine protease
MLLSGAHKPTPNKDKKMKRQKKTLVGLLAILSLAVGAFSRAQAATLEEELSDINTTISQQHAKWVAGETSLSRLSDEEKMRRVGMSELKISAKPIPEPEVTLMASMSSSLDWRDNGGNFVSGVKDQAKCGACWAFAMTGGLESNAILSGAASADVSYSEQVLISCGGVGSCDGGTLDASFLQTTGLPPTSYYPYTGTNGSCSSAGAGWQNATYKIGDWGSVTQDVSSIKAALAKYGPLPTAFMVYAGFMNYKSGVYSYVKGKKLGGHAVLLVGYNDDEQYFIVKNSWGKGWGEDGFFRISYSEMTGKSQFAMSTIAYQAGGTTNYYQDLMSKGSLDDSAKKNISQKIGNVMAQRP